MRACVCVCVCVCACARTQICQRGFCQHGFRGPEAVLGPGRDEADGAALLASAQNGCAADAFKTGSSPSETPALSSGDRVPCLFCLTRRGPLVRMESPAWCSGGWRPLIAGSLSLQRLGVDLPLTRPVWDSNLGPLAPESQSVAVSYGCNSAQRQVPKFRLLAKSGRALSENGVPYNGAAPSASASPALPRVAET